MEVHETFVDLSTSCNSLDHCKVLQSNISNVSIDSLTDKDSLDENTSFNSNTSDEEDYNSSDASFDPKTPSNTTFGLRSCTSLNSLASLGSFDDDDYDNTIKEETLVNNIVDRRHELEVHSGSRDNSLTGAWGWFNAESDEDKLNEGRNLRKALVAATQPSDDRQQVYSIFEEKRM